MSNNLIFPNLERRIKRVQVLSRRTLEVGVLENSKGIKNGKVAKLGAAELAAIHARGTIKSGGYIPPRDYQNIAFNENKDEYAKIITNTLREEKPPINMWNRIGAKMVADQKKAIRDIEPRNAQSTIEGKGKDSPLQDKRHLVKKIKYSLTKLINSLD